MFPSGGQARPPESTGAEEFCESTESWGPMLRLFAFRNRRTHPIMLTELEQIQTGGFRELAGISDETGLENFRVGFLGKRGRLTALAAGQARMAVAGYYAETEAQSRHSREGKHST